MAVSYKQICARCKKNFVLTNYKERYPICFDCQKSELSVEIEDKGMKEFFNLPEEFYRKNGFLRNIKLNYLRYKNLTEKQVAAFKKTVDTMKAEASPVPETAPKQESDAPKKRVSKKDLKKKESI